MAYFWNNVDLHGINATKQWKIMIDPIHIYVHYDYDYSYWVILIFHQHVISTITTQHCKIQSHRKRSIEEKVYKWCLYVHFSDKEGSF